MDIAKLPKPFFVLAPMDDVTDSVFRRVVASTAAPDLFYTEFVNVDGLQSVGRKNLLKKMRFTTTEQPLVLQLWGKVPENFYKTVREVVDGTFAAEMGLDGLQYAGIDLNMGCPVKGVVKNGCCSALIDDRAMALEIIKATQAAAGGALPVSVKTRLGTREVDLSWHELLLQQKLNMLTIHGRTAKQMSLVPANWELIGEVRKMRDSLTRALPAAPSSGSKPPDSGQNLPATRQRTTGYASSRQKDLVSQPDNFAQEERRQVGPYTLIVGNGDVESRAQGLELAEKYQLDGIMVGRGVFHDPFVFAKDSPWASYTKEQRIALYRKHVELFAETWQPGERAIHTLNKFCKIYINGFDGAKELREQLMSANSTDELVTILQG